MHRSVARGDRATPSSSVSWSAKPAPGDARRRREAEAALAAKADRAREAWAARHPQAAAAERKLRKRLADQKKRWDHKNEGTAETHEHASRRLQGALARLYQKGGIDAEQLAAAAEIGNVAERIAGDVNLRTVSWETRIDRAWVGDADFHERLSHVRHEVAYTRWRGQVRGPLGAVLEMIVGEPIGEPVAFTTVARRYRVHNRRAKHLLVDALDLWPRILHQVVREIDDATLMAAHAGILS